MLNLRCAQIAVGLPLLCGLANAESVVEDWTASKNSYDLHAASSQRFEILDETYGKQGKVAKFTVMPGDSFRGTSGEHTEVVLGTWRETSLFRVTGKEGIEYYRISVRLNEDWKSPERNAQGFYWGTFFQLHGPNKYAAPPAIALHAEDKFVLFVLAGDLNKKVGGRRFLERSDLNVGKWVDFVIAVNWAPDSTGWIAVYRRDEGENDWVKVSDIKSLATLQFKGTDPVESHYWKTGFYRSESKHSNSLLLGPIIRTKTFEEATGK